MSGTFTDADHTPYIARHWTAMLEESVRRIDAFRAAHPEHPILDVQYADLVADPVGTVRDLYAVTGDSLGPEAAARDRVVRRRAPEGRARHRTATTLAEFGLDAAELRTASPDYVERYDVPVEPTT